MAQKDPSMTNIMLLKSRQNPMLSRFPEILKTDHRIHGAKALVRIFDFMDPQRHKN